MLKMATYYVCSDNIDGNENSRINALCDALKKKGHEAINGGVGPNTIQSHGQSSSSSGQIGAFICGGVDIQVFWDFVQGITNGYYHYKRFIYVYASDTATSDKWLTCNGAKNTPTVQAHDDNYSGGQGDAIGKTVHQYCSEHKDIIWYACGKLGCSFQDVINNFLSGIGAGNDEGGSEASTIKDAIKDILKMRDGEIECRTVNEVMYINKIPEPQKAEISLVEGIDIIQDSINVTDVNPNTVNFLTVHWQGGEDIIIKDDALIERFGEKKAEMDAVKRVVSNDSKKEDASASDTSTDTTSDDSSSNSDVEEIPVSTLEEAQSFANTEWAKIKRDNGHTVECRVIGSPLWQQGLWVRTYIPSFEEDGYMYITKVSHDESSNGWVSNLTLQDYPPGFGDPEEAKSDDEEESDEETVSEDATT